MQKNYAKFKRELLHARKRTHVLEEIHAKEFRRERRRLRLRQDLEKKRKAARRKEYPRIFEPGYACWIPCAKLSPGMFEISSSAKNSKTSSTLGSSAFLSPPRKSRTAASYFYPSSPRNTNEPIRGTVRFSNAQRNVFSANPFVASHKPNHIGRDEWGDFEDRDHLLRSEEGKKLVKDLKTNIVLRRTLKNLGISLTDVSLNSLYDELKRRKHVRDVELELIYGNKLRNEKRFPTTQIRSWIRAAPGEHYDASKDLRTIEGAAFASAERRRRKLEHCRGTADSIEQRRKRCIAKVYRIRDHALLLKQRLRSKRELEPITPDSKGEEKPWSYVLPDELRGREISDLGVKMRQVVTSELETEPGSADGDILESRDVATLDAHGRRELDALRARRCVY